MSQPVNGKMSRGELIEELNQAIQRQGTLTVLFTHAIAQHIGLSATEFEFCDVLQHEGKRSAGELAKLCGLSSGGVTCLIDRLERAGLVKRTADPKDRRKVLVEAIHHQAHEQTVRELYTPLAQAFYELMGTYSDQELTTILDFVRRTTAITENLRPGLITKPSA
jgi:DNA-binding MarR family transcriptional regulator